MRASKRITISLRVTEADSADWRRHADALGLSLSEWIVSRCRRGDDGVSTQLPPPRKPAPSIVAAKTIPKPEPVAWCGLKAEKGKK